MQTYEEVWKDIPNYEGRYQVSSLGRVKSLEKIVSRGYLSKERILKHYTVNGYGLVDLYGKNGVRKKFLVHRLVALAFLGKSDLQVNHKNGIKSDNSVGNLEYCTSQQNIKHSIEMGLRKMGEEASVSKLTEIEAREIKYKNKGATQEEVASKYGISQSVVSAIRLGKTWKHI